MTDDAALDPGFFARDAPAVARDLIGIAMLVNGVGGRIVETEAYDAQDAASHSFRGPTPRNAVMFGPPGHVYVYRIYGMHWCVNFTCGNGAAVLIRALEPGSGIETMRVRRNGAVDRLLCAGPGRLCQALAIDSSMNGLPVDAPPFDLHGQPGDTEVTATTRIGIRVAADIPWRFCLAGSPFVSRRPALAQDSC